MTNYTLIMASPNTNASLDVPLVTMEADDESMSSNYSDSKTTSSDQKVLGGFLSLTVVVFLLLGGLHQGCRHRGSSMMKMLHTGDNSRVTEGTFGVDVSWPIHHTLKNDHGIFAPGSRQEAYVSHLQGCRNYYAQRSKAAARTCDAYEFDRMLMNKRQPQSMENYTDVGFAKVQAPPRVAALIQDFWDANKDKQVPEVWPEGNIYLNHWESPSMMVSVDDTRLRGNGYSLKKQIWDAAQTTMSAWTGGQDITPVSMYGIRCYSRGSLLVPHVDRLPLVASAMVSVAQDVEEDWPMEVYDHDGQAHNVTLHPGEMLLFESHSVLHGRPFPLKGNFYCMLFIHFEPTGKTPLQQKIAVDEQYRQAVQDGVGGQSSSQQSQLLPPYIRRFSPEEDNWQRENPDGWWQAPASAPLSDQAKPKPQPEEHQAARDGDLEYWRVALLEAKDDEDFRYKLVHRRDSNGWQPIHESAVNGKKEIIDLLLDAGANINARTNGGRGGTPLFLAQQKLGAEHPIVRYLVERGALSIPPDNFREEL